MTRLALKPPFFVLDGHDVEFCRSLEDLERFIEPIDAPRTKAYDATGRVVELHATTSEPRRQGWLAKWFPGRTVTRALPSSISDPETLEAALKRYLARLDLAVGQYQLADIVANLDRFGVCFS